MVGKWISTIGSIFILLVSLIVIWVNWTNSRASKTVVESNQSLHEGNQLILKIADDLVQLFSDETMKDFPANREQLRPKAELASTLLGEAAAKYRDAAEKSGLASKQIANSTIEKHWQLQTKHLIKLGESKETFRKLVELLLDPKIVDVNQLNEQSAPFIEEFGRQNKESDDFAAQAAKIKKENKSLFAD